MEEWRPIEGFEGRYEVSSEGRVRNGPRLLKAQKGRYHHVRLSLKGKVTIHRIHRLVCEAFHGPGPEGKPMVLHGDGDPHNNSASNLRWGSQVENEADKARHGRNANANKGRCPRDHLLIEPNLEAWSAARGMRKCLSCSREAALSRVQGREFDPAKSDIRYEEIMRGPA